MYQPRLAYQQEVRPQITATSDLNGMDMEIFNKTMIDEGILTYLLTPWSRVLLEKLTSKLCR